MKMINNGPFFVPAFLGKMMLATMVFALPLSSAFAQDSEFISEGPTVPYDPEIHGPALVLPAGGSLLPPPERPQLTTVPIIPVGLPGDGNRGMWVWNGTGIYAKNDLQTDLEISDDAIGTEIYAPAHMPANYSCLETVAAHWRYEGMETTAHGHGFWDHCGDDGEGGWQLFEYITEEWKDKYITVEDGNEVYYTQVYKDDEGTWHGLLYNFEAEQWEDKTTVTGTGSAWYKGWTMWESHNLEVCSDFPNIRATNIEVDLDNDWWDWVPLISSYTSQLGPYGDCWEDDYYMFDILEPDYSWEAITSEDDNCINMGPEHTRPEIEIEGDVCVQITQWTDWSWGWTPGYISVGVTPVDGAPMDGIEMTIDGETTSLSNWWQELATPYTEQDELVIELSSSTNRHLVFTWWARD